MMFTVLMKIRNDTCSILTIFFLMFSSNFIAAEETPVDVDLPLRHSFPGSQVPFADKMDNGIMRDLVKELHLYGADPTHEYIISTFSTQQFALPLTRVVIEIQDITDNVVVCGFRSQTMDASTVAAFVATLPDTIKLTDVALASKTKMYAVMTVDWSAATDANRSYTTVAQAGIHASRIMSDEMIADYLDRDSWHQVIRCGAGETYTTLKAAVEATYSPLTGSATINGSPICEFAHYHNRVLIDIVDDGDFKATGLYLPDWVDVRGNGRDRTFIRRENTDPEPLIEQRTSGKFIDCTLVSETANEYCIHSDDFNRNSTGDKNQNVRLRQSYKRLRLQGGTGHNGWLFGNGMSSGQVIEFEDVVGEHLDASATEPAFGFHNTGPTLRNPMLKVSYKSAQVTMRGCSSPDQVGIEISTLEPSAICHLTLIDSDFNLIKHETSSGNEVLSDLARDRVAWQIGGRHDGPWINVDPVGQIVLKTTAGQIPSGTASALIFGAMDELGRGEKWIKDATDYDLGSRLGDCSSVNKMLTIGSQTCIFTADETRKSNAVLISEINASITSHPVSEVDLQLEWAPDAVPKRRMNNNTGSTIPKGRFVKFTGAGTIALCGTNEKPDGWTHRDILNGDDGYVILTKRIADDYIENASGSTGKWGITASGKLDYSATTKQGLTTGGIVTVY
ncbi:MAG: hypothetical protein K0U86_09645 [Planctomycetes bacterium]|nr:hypothetical protein [Planctomycetota bacterium]MCH9725154.1 hypothetical protein [Planctomycetota bacterium]MCH9774885.1 hypothetical protein [Planctomycetota bacterium]MCH9791821.1 hypothetical protein [Planctomycetota bacterium]